MAANGIFALILAIWILGFAVALRWAMRPIRLRLTKIIGPDSYFRQGKYSAGGVIPPSKEVLAASEVPLPGEIIRPKTPPPAQSKAMTNPTEAVTQADLDAAKSLCDYFCWVTIPDEVVQAFARHRHKALAQGRLEGVEVGLGMAAGIWPYRFADAMLVEQAKAQRP